MAKVLLKSRDQNFRIFTQILNILNKPISKNIQSSSNSEKLQYMTSYLIIEKTQIMKFPNLVEQTVLLTIRHALIYYLPLIAGNDS